MNIVNLEWLSELWGYVVGGGADLPDHPWRDLNPDDTDQVVAFARTGVGGVMRTLPLEQRRRFAATLRYATDHLEERALERYLVSILPPFATPRNPRAFYRTVLGEAFGGGPDGPFAVYNDLAFRIRNPEPPGPPLKVVDGPSLPDRVSLPKSSSEAANVPKSKRALYEAVRNELERRLPDTLVEPKLRSQLDLAEHAGLSVREHLTFVLESLEDPQIDPADLLTLLEDTTSNA